MTVISTSYDALIVLVGATLGSTWVRLTNPDELQNNFDSFLRGGWGVLADSTTNTNRQLCSRKSFSRSYTVILCVEFFGANTTYTEQDDSIKKILEAATSVAIAIENDQTLAVSGGHVVANYIGDSGIVPIELDDRKFITCSINITLETFL
jgi:hypothetical protein